GEKAANSSGDTSSSKAEAAGTDFGNKTVGAAVSEPENAKTSLTRKAVGTSSDASKVEAGTRPRGGGVGRIGVVVLALYLIAAILFCFYGLIALWPLKSPSQLGQLPPVKAAVTPTRSAASLSGSMIQSSSATSAGGSIPTPTPFAALSSGSPTETSS